MELQQMSIFPISDRILVMGSPFVQDRLSDVQRYFAESLRGQLRVFNAEDEEAFSVEQELLNVVSFPLQSGCAPALESIVELCTGAESFLSAKTDNFVVFHCKNGKAKSSFFAACLSLHCGIRSTANDVIDLVHTQRGESVLRSPSLLRYLHYYERLLRNDRVLCQSLSLQLLRINTIPRFTASIVSAGCTPSLGVYQLVRKNENDWFYRKIAHVTAHSEYCEGVHTCIEFAFSRPALLLRGDIVICAFHSQEKMFQLSFHTAFVEKSSYLFFEKSVIDIACEDTKHRLFSKDFSVELVLRRVPDDQTISQLSETDALDGFSSHSEVKYEHIDDE